MISFCPLLLLCVTLELLETPKEYGIKVYYRVYLEFFINYPANLLFHPDTLFLFEILDFNHQALVYRNDEETFDKNNFYRVAWSFLRPVGLSRNHIGKSQL